MMVLERMTLPKKFGVRSSEFGVGFFTTEAQSTQRKKTIWLGDSPPDPQRQKKILGVLGVKPLASPLSLCVLCVSVVKFLFFFYLLYALRYFLCLCGKNLGHSSC